MRVFSDDKKFFVSFHFYIKDGKVEYVILSDDQYNVYISKEPKEIDIERLIKYIYGIGAWSLNFSSPEGSRSLEFIKINNSHFRTLVIKMLEKHEFRIQDDLDPFKYNTDIIKILYKLHDLLNYDN